MQVFYKPLMILILLMSTSSAWSQNAAVSGLTYWPQTFWQTLMTQWSLKKEAYDRAYQHSLKALEKDPLAPELQINLGNSLESLGSLAKAREAYGTAEKLSKDPGIQFQSRFNQAQALAKEKKTDEALALYQKALELDPESQIVKTNIEMLMNSSGGQGQGDSKDQQDQDGKSGQDQKDQSKGQQFEKNPKNSPKQPKDLNQADIKKILEELKQQEQRIRGDFYKQENREKKAKGEDSKREKDW